MRKIITLLYLLLVLINPLLAEDDDYDRSAIKVHAMRLESAIKIDGSLSESIWHNDSGISNFIQRNPIEGSTPTEKTEVHIAYDAEAIYVAARMYDSSPDSIIARLSRKDDIVSSDSFVFFVDPYNDDRSGYYFGLNAGGTLFDGVLYNDEWDDDSWDGVWEGKAQIDARGWCVEIRIPFSQLRFHNNTQEHIWGVNFKRIIERKNEEDYVVFTPKNGSGFVSRFVDLLGIQKISTNHHLEILPYFRTKAEYTHPDAGNPFNDGSRFLPATGIDLKFGITNNLTLNATINPDFGQVEVDPAVVNLSDFETFYSEKRPFFIEGAKIFDGFGSGGANSNYGFNWGSPDFFYSRRIGRSPQGSINGDYDYSNIPEGTRILGAAKLTGKIGNNWNIGMIHAFTAKEMADITMNGSRSRQEVEPFAYYGVFRGLREFNKGRQGIGFISSVALRKFDNQNLKNEINRNSTALGLDGWTLLGKNQTWAINGWLGASQINSSRERMLDVQTNAYHYFQRPDVNHVHVDSNATSLTGYGGRLAVNKQKGNFILNSAVGVIDPNFDVNDLGFQWRTDLINFHFVTGYKWTQPGKIARSASVRFATFRNFDFSKNMVDQGYFHFGYLQFLNYTSLNWSMYYSPETLNNRLTRGGPLTLRKTSYSGSIFFRSDRRKTWVYGLGTAGWQSKSGGWDWRIDPQIEWKPAANVDLRISPGFSRNYEDAQYVDVFDDPLAVNTFGKRYVFAELDQTTLSASIRLNWTFSPNLSFQLYMQPLISSGNYFNFKELSRPRSYDFLEYGTNQSTFSEDTYTADPDGNGPAKPIDIGNPDFNYKSLRGNAVLRWEYIPGSILYLVWTQSRLDDENIGEFNFQHSFDRLIHTQADNIFMIKFSYWWGL